MKFATKGLVGLALYATVEQSVSAFNSHASFVASTSTGIKQTTALHYIKEEDKQMKYTEKPYFLSEVTTEIVEAPARGGKAGVTEVVKKAPLKAMKKKKGKAPTHKTGVFSPVVLTAKTMIGEESLNKVRAKAISLHSDVIGKFVNTYDTPFGRAALLRLFQVADRNGDGVLEKDEVAEAVRKLGFTWLGEKQVAGIVKRADTDSNGAIDFEEFEAEAPRTLRNNLVKLAKKNGGDMGLLV